MNENLKEDIISKLLEIIQEEKNIFDISKKLNISELEILGIIHDLIKEGKNITIKETDNGFLLLNKEDSIIDIESNGQSFTTDENNEFKFVAISDTKLGSKHQQLEILNDIYAKAQTLGINNVILCGNISAGITNSKSNFIDDTQEQIDYIVKNYPKYEGITTYFITGKEDEKHNKKADTNIGKNISEQRPDMIYLGKDTCDIKIDNTNMQIISSKLGKTYTISYRPQQIINAYSKEDKPDILLYSGLLQMEKFKYRGVNCISVPSACRPDKENEIKGYSNTLGAWYITIQTDEKGKLKTINAIDSPYFITNKEDYKKNIIKLPSPKKAKINIDKASIETALKLYNYIKNEMPVDTFMEKFHINYNELQGILQILELCGKKVEIISNNNIQFFKKNPYKGISFNKNNFNKLTCTEILVVSDTHFGNVHNQLHLLNDLYQEAYNRGITIAIHLGDITDGNYPENSQISRQQFLHGFDEQVGYVVDMYPLIDGMTTYYILGNTDETHYKNGKSTVNEWLKRNREDMKFIGQDKGKITINKVKYLLEHPRDKIAQRLSYNSQKRIETLESNTEPNIILLGHYHRSYHLIYRDIHCIQVPSLCDKTQNQQNKVQINTVGGYFLKVWSDKNGNVQYMEPEEILYEGKNIWNEAGKDKSKVKKLTIPKGIY